MSERLTPAQVAKMIGIEEDTLLKWMRQGRGPAFYRLTRLYAYFELADVEAWIEGQKQVPRGRTLSQIERFPQGGVKTLPSRFSGKRLAK